MPALLLRIAAGVAATAIAAVALAQAAEKPEAKPTLKKAWIAPGQPGSQIDGQMFHAQVLLDAAGFSPGVIDGRNGSSFKQALKGFQEARGLEATGALDRGTKLALLQANKPSIIAVKLAAEDVVSNYVYPLPK